MDNQAQLTPKAVFDCFAQVNRVPRPSKHEEQMIAFLQQFGEGLGLDTRVDETGNVIIRKPATPGYENRKTVILQSHSDMVCEKNADLDFDFMKDAIQTYVDGEWMKAKGTTLGADDGIGVAMEMAILQATDIEHGPIECVFTRDEETGLTGAEGMKPGFMTGDYLINLDSEDEGQMFVSCAGGARTTAYYDYTFEPLPAGYFAAKVYVKGLSGGHSGDDINKKRANANRLIVRFLCDEMEQTDLRLLDIQSGGLHNAIPREGWALIAVPAAYKEQLRIDLNVFASEVREEYATTEPDMLIDMESVADAPQQAIAKTVADKMLLSLRAVHNGVYAMSQDLDWLVETSSNLASIHREQESIVVTTSQRSSVASRIKEMTAVVRAAFTLGGARAVTNEGYPGWKMNPNSEIVKIAAESYRRLFNKDPKILAIHAGLECGLFSEKYPHLDMVSFGPTLRGVHSPDERLLIPTVQMVWDHLLDILRNIPNK
ncbi:MAG: aminoacyl-histidine dipeptidase [Bacteroidales bacterium]|nr:aminoacyl-histidine dipeptidase [Candidatus Equimonas enterica]